MKRRVGTWLSIVACMHAVTMSAPAFAQPKKGGAAPAPAEPARPTEPIARGQSLFEDQQYEESIQTLSGALLRPTNTKEQKIEIFRLLALNYITLNRKEEAENAVRGLLAIAPEYALPPSESPKFRDFFAQVRQKWEAEGRPGAKQDETPPKPITVKHSAPSEQEPGKAVEIRARLDDPDGRAGGVKVFFRTGSKGEFTEVDAEGAGEGRVKATIPAASVQPPVVDYYFEVVDGQGTVIATRGDPGTPLRFAVVEPSKGGWVLPVAIGGGIVGVGAIIGGLALAGVFKGSSSGGGGNGGGGGKSTVTISIGDQSFRAH